MCRASPSFFTERGQGWGFFFHVYKKPPSLEGTKEHGALVPLGVLGPSWFKIFQQQERTTKTPRHEGTQRVIESCSPSSCPITTGLCLISVPPWLRRFLLKMWVERGRRWVSSTPESC